MSQEPEDLTAFKDRLWRAVVAARRRYSWCGVEMNILRRLGVTEPRTVVHGLPEPQEDGVYRISAATYFFIRYSDTSGTYWVITALHHCRQYTSVEAGTWADVVTFLQANSLMPDEHRQLVKF